MTEKTSFVWDSPPEKLKQLIKDMPECSVKRSMAAQIAKPSFYYKCLQNKTVGYGGINNDKCR